MPKQAKQIVVITDRRDAHLPFVQKHLDQQLIILDPQTLLEKQELTFRLEKDQMVVTYGNHRLDKVGCVWYRKPRDITRKYVQVSKEYLDYATNALQGQTLQLLSSFRNALWVSDFMAMRRANNKSWQLEVAAKLGFRVPATVMTSNPDTARQFIESQESCIVKTFYAYSPEDKSVQKSFFTTKIYKSDPPDLDNLYLAPAIFQQCIDAIFDVRVTVVGTKVFAALIHHNNVQESNIRDWRLGHLDGDLQIEAYKDFPDSIAKLCVQHVKALGLSFGAIDLVMDKKGQLWFIENNPNGQWGFVERYAGLPIGKAMGELLHSSV